ncbi:MAG: hydroxyacid dehydrogenase, partial [Selenomonadaceae bacterium]|nr:hydroxyacid dehydrogenase [Selenomonadaceae bacterium]
MAKVLKDVLFKDIPAIDEGMVDAALAEALKDFPKKIVVLDDDPTGVQTVHDISVYTEWTEDSIAAGFAEKNPMFFILTNSRAFSAEHTTEEHRKMAERIAAESKRSGKEFMVISRSDSTLRGHYPLETKVLRETLEKNGSP